MDEWGAEERGPKPLWQRMVDGAFVGAVAAAVLNVLVFHEPGVVGPLLFEMVGGVVGATAVGGAEITVSVMDEFKAFLESDAA